MPGCGRRGAFPTCPARHHRPPAREPASWRWSWDARRGTQARKALQAGSYLIKTPLRYTDAHFFYTAYYGSQAMFQLGHNYWTIYRPRLHAELLDHQQRNGGWINNEATGPTYNTAMAILALTVEYRLLPIFQRTSDSMNEANS